HPCAARHHDYNGRCRKSQHNRPFYQGLPVNSSYTKPPITPTGTAKNFHTTQHGIASLVFINSLKAHLAWTNMPAFARQAGAHLLELSRGSGLFGPAPLPQELRKQAS